jgi:hypothetical protein
VSARHRLERVFAPDVLADLVELVRETFDEEREPLERAPSRPWLTLAEAAELEGCSYDAMRKRARRGRYETRHVGRTMYVSSASLNGRR